VGSTVTPGTAGTEGSEMGMAHVRRIRPSLARIRGHIRRTCAGRRTSQRAGAAREADPRKLGLPAMELGGSTAASVRPG